MRAAPNIATTVDAIPLAGGMTLDFNGIDSVFEVQANGTLVFDGIYMKGTPTTDAYFQENPTTSYPFGLAGFPSILCDSGCQVR